MADLSEQLSAILQNPEAQQNIMNLFSSLQQKSPTPEQKSEVSSFDYSPVTGGDASFGVDMNMLMKLQGILSKMSCDDRNVNLLMALKPHLHQPKKVDEAINILRLISVLPALDESGFFGGGRT